MRAPRVVLRVVAGVLAVLVPAVQVSAATGAEFDRGEALPKEGVVRLYDGRSPATASALELLKSVDRHGRARSFTVAATFGNGDRDSIVLDIENDTIMVFGVTFKLEGRAGSDYLVAISRGSDVLRGSASRGPSSFDPASPGRIFPADWMARVARFETALHDHLKNPSGRAALWDAVGCISNILVLTGTWIGVFVACSPVDAFLGCGGAIMVGTGVTIESARNIAEKC